MEKSILICFVIKEIIKQSKKKCFRIDLYKKYQELRNFLDDKKIEQDK